MGSRREGRPRVVDTSCFLLFRFVRGSKRYPLPSVTAIRVQKYEFNLVVAERSEAACRVLPPSPPHFLCGFVHFVATHTVRQGSCLLCASVPLVAPLNFCGPVFVAVGCEKLVLEQNRGPG